MFRNEETEAPCGEATCHVVVTGTQSGPLTQNSRSLIRETDLRRERAGVGAELGAGPSRGPDSHFSFLPNLLNTSTLAGGCHSHLSTPPPFSVEQHPLLGKEIGPMKSFTVKC